MKALLWIGGIYLAGWAMIGLAFVLSFALDPWIERYFRRVRHK